MAQSKVTPNVLASQGHVLSRLEALRSEPPQCLLIEGGTADERFAAALHWASMLNCGGLTVPCNACHDCRQIWDLAHRDLLTFGTEGTIPVEEVREARPVWGQPPQGSYRVTIFVGAETMNVFTANALLKSLEEPRPGNVFVLLAPQRERLLETLVSRSWVLTLSWPDPSTAEPDTEVQEWLTAMAGFWRTGQGWFGRTQGKGAVDADLAMRILLGWQRELRLAMSGQCSTRLSAELCRLFDAHGLRRLDLALDEVQKGLTTQVPVNPALVLDWLATRMAR